MYWLFSVFGLLAIPLLALMAAYFGLLGTLIAVTRAHPPLLRAALVALCALGVEWLRGDAWYLRFPWYTPPHALASAPIWIAPVSWLGSYGFSYVLWFIAAAGAFRKPLLWTLFLVVPATSWLLPEVGEPDRRVLLLQSEDRGSADVLIPTIPAEKVDLAVLPEIAYPSIPPLGPTASNGPAALARKMSSPVVFGAEEEVTGSAQFYNIAVVIDADGNLIGKFIKQRPVPLMDDGIPGTERPVFAINGEVLGLAICYDFDAPGVAASLTRSGATVLVLPTFDAMFWSRVQHLHHELLVRLRAVENNRWILRSASSGRTEVVNPHGVPSERGIAVGEVGCITLPFAYRQSKVVGSYLAFLGPAAGAGTLLYLLILAGARRFEKRQAPANSLDHPEVC
jgi:apolipoprotein N-acyltransferase